MASLVRAAACHASPVFLSARATTDKALSLIHQAAKNKANIVVFPETYIPAFPVWSALRPPTENHDLFRRMALESVLADGEEVQAIRATAKQTGTIVSMGISERVHSSSATLYNSNLLIGSNGDILVHHRKLVPTFFEKLTWSNGDGHGLRVSETAFGKIGNLICGENTNSLARYALMAQGEQIHISTWPAVWPTRPLKSVPSSVSGGPGSQDDKNSNGTSSTSRNYDNVSANKTRAAAHCFEAKCYGIVCAGVLENEAIKIIAEGAEDPDRVSQIMRDSQRGISMFFDPTGAPIQGFTVNSANGEMEAREFLQKEEGILYADFHLEECIEGKQYHDVAGGYQRLDVFELRVNRHRKSPAVFSDSSVHGKTLDTRPIAQTTEAGD
ncbi:nitrilase [Diaporthe amygdali]|uniref:nitrilase n=1 Tax=Phomopsis amygdali TaxID=1214568 RepID=UPI0022FF26F8|nr:nitrilase [Diaporthe amygdali]KAJ0118590.1 nitrilase [Diaporthe amygdali]